MTQKIADLTEDSTVSPEGLPMETLTVAAGFLEEFLKETDLDKHPVVEGMMAGQSAGQAMGLSRDDLEVLYAAGFNQLNAGNFAKAEDAFMYLCMIDPLEAKNHYCFGMALQMGGKPEQAAPIYINFLGLDATNPYGYLRYGECLMAQGDRAEALEAFRLALAEADVNDKDPAAAAEARAKIALAEKDS